jgi:hypothetical protein
METPLTLLYTHGLRGDLEALPKLYSFLRQLKAYYTSEEVVQVCALDPAETPGRVLLLDLGENCAPDVWHCAVSGGRSTLVVLDGMGYDAARTENAPEKEAKMGEGVRLALVDAQTPRMIEDVLITVSPSPLQTQAQGLLSPLPRSGERGENTPAYTLNIVLAPAETTRLDGNMLSLAVVSGVAQVGAARLARVVEGWTLTGQEIHELPRRILPDPTIAASVDFVLSEARYAQKRQLKQ